MTVTVGRRLLAIEGVARHACVYTGEEQESAHSAIVLVTSRTSNDGLWLDLRERSEAPWHSLTRIGDALAPATVAHAVYAGHRYAREFEATPITGAPYKRERVVV